MTIFARRGYWADGSWRIQSYPRRMYMFYSVREMKRKYREEFGLKGKHNVEFVDYNGFRLI